MATKKKMTVSTQSTSSYRPTAAQRRAAEIAWLSTRQAELKREAADRRAERAVADAAGTRGS